MMSRCLTFKTLFCHVVNITTVVKSTMSMQPVKVGIIGGSGLNDPDIFVNIARRQLTTVFGEPSGDIIEGRIGDVDCAILPRHGWDHSITPSRINYKANIRALKDIGCTHVLATAAVGGLQEHTAPGDFLVLDDFFDRTTMRQTSFYDGLHQSFPEVVHVPSTEPFCQDTRQVLIDACQEVLPTKYSSENEDAQHPCYHDRGCICVIEGPRFSTRTESRVWHERGFDVIGMTTFPECMLAKEAGLCYAVCAMVTDYDCWKAGEVEVSAGNVVEQMKVMSGKMKAILLKAIEMVGKRDWTAAYERHKRMIQSSKM